MKKPEPLFSKHEVSVFVSTYLIPTLCVIGLFIGKRPVFFGCPVENHVLYIITHGNILHFIINMVSYFGIIKFMPKSYGRLLIPFIIIGVLCGFAAINPTVGMSGAIYGLLGMQAIGVVPGGLKFGRKHYVIVFYTIGFSVLIPHISWSLHLAGFLLGMIYQLIINYYERNR